MFTYLPGASYFWTRVCVDSEIRMGNTRINHFLYIALAEITVLLNKYARSTRETRVSQLQTCYLICLYHQLNNLSPNTSSNQNELSPPIPFLLNPQLYLPSDVFLSLRASSSLLIVTLALFSCSSMCAIVAET